MVAYTNADCRSCLSRSFTGAAGLAAFAAFVCAWLLGAEGVAVVDCEVLPFRPKLGRLGNQPGLALLSKRQVKSSRKMIHQQLLLSHTSNACWSFFRMLAALTMPAFFQSASYSEMEPDPLGAVKRVAAGACPECCANCNN